jgi:hypothetical protein
MPLESHTAAAGFYTLRTEREGDQAVALGAAARRQLNTDLQLASRSSVTPSQGTSHIRCTAHPGPVEPIRGVIAGNRD